MVDKKGAGLLSIRVMRAWLRADCPRLFVSLLDYVTAGSGPLPSAVGWQTRS